MKLFLISGIILATLISVANAREVIVRDNHPIMHNERFRGPLPPFINLHRHVWPDIHCVRILFFTHCY